MWGASASGCRRQCRYVSPVGMSAGAAQDEIGEKHPKRTKTKLKRSWGCGCVVADAGGARIPALTLYTENLSVSLSKEVNMLQSIRNTSAVGSLDERLVKPTMSENRITTAGVQRKDGGVEGRVRSGGGAGSWTGECAVIQRCGKAGLGLAVTVIVRY